MDNWLKGLVAAACVVVISAGGYYLLGQFQSWRAAKADRELTETVRTEIFKLARAAPGDISGARAFCKQITERLDSDLKDNSEAHRVSKNCRALGYVY